MLQALQDLEICLTTLFLTQEFFIWKTNLCFKTILGDASLCSKGSAFPIHVAQQIGIGPWAAIRGLSGSSPCCPTNASYLFSMIDSALICSLSPKTERLPTKNSLGTNQARFHHLDLLRPRFTAYGERLLTFNQSSQTRVFEVAVKQSQSFDAPNRSDGTRLGFIIIPQT